MLKSKLCIQMIFKLSLYSTLVRLNFNCIKFFIDFIYFPEDYLNPISKEEIMQESGLGRRHDEFYLIDPGITSVNGTDESTEVFEIFHEDFNLSYFGNNCIA